MPAKNDEQWQHVVGKIRAITRWSGDDDPRLPELRAQLRRAELEDHVRRIVAQIPPLTDQQRGRIMALLFASPVPVVAEVAAPDSDTQR